MLQTVLLEGSWGSFFGHFHPLFVHLPIGMLLIGMVLEYYIRYKNQTILNDASSIVFFWGSVSAILSCVAGYYLKQGGGYEESTLNWHQYLGIAVAAVSVLFYLSKKWDFLAKARNGMLVSIAVLLAVTGHLGGNMTHGSDYLTTGLPQPYKGWLGGADKANKKKETDPTKAIVYKDVIEPIFEAKCWQCHNSEKQKGELRMDTEAFFTKGGKHGAIFKANDPTGSELIKRAMMDIDEELHMPPKGKEQLTEAEIALINWWIKSGGSFTQKVAEAPQDDKIKPILAAAFGGAAIVGGMVAGAPATESPIYNLKLPKATEADIKALINKKLVVETISNQSSLLSINAVNFKEFADKDMASVNKVGNLTVWLKLTDTQITDASLTQIAKLPNLIKLHLTNTKITDNGIAALVGSKNLEYINLVGTQVTNGVFAKLGTFKNLKKVFLWQTKVTKEAVNAFRISHPNIEIDYGWEEVEPIKDSITTTIQ